jgi:hypothetical protein
MVGTEIEILNNVIVDHALVPPSVLRHPCEKIVNLLG